MLQVLGGDSAGVEVLKWDQELSRAPGREHSAAQSLVCEVGNRDSI